MNKLYNRIDWVNNTTPAINETNLNLMSKGIDDIDDRVVYLANEVIGDTPVKMNVDGSNAANAVTFPGSLTTGGNITDGSGNVLSNKMETDGSNSAAAVSLSGDMYARNIAASRNISASRDIAGRNITAGIDITAENDITANGDITAQGDITAYGDVTDGNGNVLSNKQENIDLSIVDGKLCVTYEI